MPPARTEKSEPLIRRIWWTYFRTALIPLLLVEVALVLVYVLANNLARRENTQAIRDVAVDELSRIAKRESVVIDNELVAIRGAVSVFATAAGDALQRRARARRSAASSSASSASARLPGALDGREVARSEPAPSTAVTSMRVGPVRGWSASHAAAGPTSSRSSVRLSGRAP